MFSLVALMCLYLGTSNISKALRQPFRQWASIHWMLAISGVLLILVGIACVWQAVKDAKERGEKAKEKEEKEARQRKRQFFYDDDDYQSADGISDRTSDEEESL